MIHKVYLDLLKAYQNNYQVQDNEPLKKINIVKITNNEIFTNYSKKNDFLKSIIFFLLLFFLFWILKSFLKY
jgi:hypothetical protein